MAFERLMNSVLLAAAVSLVAACASSPTNAPAPSATPAPVAAPASEAKPEADAATLAEKRFQEAARSYRKVEKDGKTMYCKKEKPMGSTVPRTQCIAESQLRLEVEQMDELRDRMRNTGGRCTHGTGCGGGG
jgi:hypothetical protein